MSRGTLQCVDGAIDKLLLAFSANHTRRRFLFVGSGSRSRSEGGPFPGSTSARHNLTDDANKVLKLSVCVVIVVIHRLKLL